MPQDIELAVVVPSIRPEAMEKWLDKWKFLLTRDDVEVIIVWDMFRKDHPGVIDVASTQLFHDDIGDYKDLVPTKSDSVRNLGFLKAAELGAKYIATLDDDVYPTDNLWVEKMIHNLKRDVNPYVFKPCSFTTRGTPSNMHVPVILHHGLWQGIPDVYAKDQYEYEILDGQQTPVKTIPHGQLFPMCGMNIAFWRELLPAMYFWPQSKYRRYGDIWCGLVAKRTIDIMGYAVTSGSPVVYHDRMSNREKNKEHEEEGSSSNDRFWRGMVETWPNIKTLESVTLADVVDEIADEIQPFTSAVDANLKEWVKVTRKLVGL